jgi:hypothetical protein
MKTETELRQWLVEHIDDYIEVNDSMTIWYKIDKDKLAKELFKFIAGE